jgi:hypothetical protein
MIIPTIEVNPEHDTIRVGKNINLLFKYGADVESNSISIRSAWNAALQPEYEYTTPFSRPCQLDRPYPRVILYVIQKCPWMIPGLIVQTSS